MPYDPQPIDTSDAILSAELLELTELLAKNTHDHWARQRLAKGWKYGPRRDDARKEHPNLVAYEQLDKAEKEYDRLTAIETLKAITTLGFTITRA